MNGFWLVKNQEDFLESILGKITGSNFENDVKIDIYNCTCKNLYSIHKGNLMIKHIVFFKLEDNSETNKKFIQDKIMSMKGKIEYLKHIEVGINFSPEERAFDLALITDFESKEDLAAYAINPIHVEIVNYLKSVNTITKVVDYEY